eukprot:7012852-Pyramimonas_sp.AAC.1
MASHTTQTAVIGTPPLTRKHTRRNDITPTTQTVYRTQPSTLEALQAGWYHTQHRSLSTNGTPPSTLEALQAE